MKPEPLVSVIMNCYNGEKYLREAIDSVMAQTYQNWEIIFWDNASTDDTQKIATSYDSRLKYFRADINTPLGLARNRALKKATGKYVAFLDCDDVYLPCKLQKQVEIMESGNYGLVYGSTIVIDGNGNEIKRLKLKYKRGYILDQLLRRYDISMCSAMVRQSVLKSEKIEFKENFGYCPDYNLFVKIAARHPAAVLSEFIVKYRRTSTSLSKKTLHLVSQEIGNTLDELEELYPDVLSFCDQAINEARSKLNFYEAVKFISLDDYPSARTVLGPVIWRRWEYLAIYSALFFPVPNKWMLRVLNR